MWSSVMGWLDSSNQDNKQTEENDSTHNATAQNDDHTTTDKASEGAEIPPSNDHPKDAAPVVGITMEESADKTPEKEEYDAEKAVLQPFVGIWSVVKEFTSALQDENKEILEKITALKESPRILTAADNNQVADAGQEQEELTRGAFLDTPLLLVDVPIRNGQSSKGADPVSEALETIGASLERNVDVDAITKNISTAASSAFGFFSKMIGDDVLGVSSSIDAAGQNRNQADHGSPQISSVPISAKDAKLSRIKGDIKTYTDDPIATPETEKFLSFSTFKGYFKVADYSERLKEVLINDPVVKGFHENLVLLGTVPEDIFWLRFFFRVELLEKEEQVRKQLLEMPDISKSSEPEKGSLNWENDEDEDYQYVTEDLGTPNESEAKPVDAQKEEKDVQIESTIIATGAPPLSPADDEDWADWN